MGVQVPSPAPDWKYSNFLKFDFLLLFIKEDNKYFNSVKLHGIRNNVAGSNKFKISLYLGWQPKNGEKVVQN